MKTLVMLSCLSFSVITSAANLGFRCDVLSLKDSNVFEEGLGPTGHSDVDEDSQNIAIRWDGKSGELQVGQHSFSSEDEGTNLIYQEGPNDHKFTATVEQTQKVRVTVYKKSKLGVLLQKDEWESKYKVVADLDCNDYSKVKKYMLSSNAKLVQIKKGQIAQAFLKRMSQIDVPFEMGDGYYDLKSENYYKVSLDNKVVGYVLESIMYYSEDNEDITTRTYFLANGVRFSGPN